MKTLFVILALAAGIAAPTIASATNCTTTCTGSGNFRTCNTWCY